MSGWNVDRLHRRAATTPASTAVLTPAERQWLDAESVRQQLAEDQQLIAQVDALLAERHPTIWTADLPYLRQVAA